MEGFVHQTRAQRLSDVRAALTDAFAIADLPKDQSFQETLERIERAEQQLQRDHDDNRTCGIP